ncbi:M14 family metallopeptidase [Erwinia piriflorinigrans]|uniref:Peptidase M14 domain-containing protein n=1 Tax=Erwinia piriflorinigrans CFBP 5888 TaxID=1161919 RepID=V5ZBA7_9GAMM|nr:M14 family metallocarboxypeptidase [Erwinia piriflorinigrans]CCG88673.1 hypothetical protein EPIR_3310 [Erwinia piriflorinigrans CFBP 5888]
MTEQYFYPIGTPGIAWQRQEIDAWRNQQRKQRSYGEILALFRKAARRAELTIYGHLNYASENYELIALRSSGWDNSLPVALITGGVHGYETSGVLAPFRFLHEHTDEYVGRINLLIAPCVSPWAYERITRWNYNAIDTNRQFRVGGESAEADALMALVAPWKEKILVHVDLHETTDTDESEFSPALAARDGEIYKPENIPDGFYLVSDTANSRPDFQSAIIESVSKMTHIAPSGENGMLLGYPTIGPGVVEYPNREYGLCSTISDARYTTTTEVYPDNNKTDPEECIRAQVAAIRAALDFALANPS